MDKKEDNNKTGHHVSYKATHASHVKTSEDKPRKEVDSKKSLMYVLIGVCIVILLIATPLLLSKYVFKNKNIVEYNHYVFEKFEGNKWMTQQMIGGQLYNIPFYNNPQQVLDIPVDPNAVKNLRIFKAYTNGTYSTIYIVVDPNESSKVVLAGVEYARILGTGYNIYNMNVKSAISRPVDTGVEIPIVTCKNQSRNTFVIYQTVTGKNLITVNGGCIVLESRNANESIRVADAFAFRLLNIIQDPEQNVTTTDSVQRTNVAKKVVNYSTNNITASASQDSNKNGTLL